MLLLLRLGSSSMERGEKVEDEGVSGLSCVGEMGESG